MSILLNLVDLVRFRRYTILTQELLKEHFEYRDGHLWWIKPRARSSVKAGKQFGSYANGYRIGKLRGKSYYEHRLIWLYYYGEWPKDQIDHINGVRDDNRIENLREATRQQNSFNRKSEKDSASNYKGVTWHKRHKKWQAQHRYKGKTYCLGLYEAEEDAADAYRKATGNLRKEYANYD